MERKLNDRRRRVLSALVEEYVASAHPVASKSLCDRYDLGCSPATVRNELAALEETGHVLQPHVSAGRVPTDSGYRVFVDELDEGGTLDDDEVEAVHAEYGRVTAEVDDLMRETSSLLTKLTNYVAVVVAPTVVRARIRRVDLVSLTPTRALVVVITDDGRVADRAVELPSDALPEELGDLERQANALLEGKRADEVGTLRIELGRRPEDERLRTLLLEGVEECLLEADRERLYHGGTTALLGQPEFADAERFAPLLRLLEDGLAMLESLGDVIAATDVVVRIGHENRARELGEMSVVAANYGVGTADGLVGVIGPTRMDYVRAMAAVRCVSENLSHMLSS